MVSSTSHISFSGAQPSGELHLGNYLGAIKQWVRFQESMGADDKLIFSIVDLHAMTLPFEPKVLQARTLELAAWYLAAGLDPQKVTLFVQSENPDHTLLAWILNCVTPMGWMERMIQYKEKSTKQGERVSVGLFDYPALMAADILLYDTHSVPVGEDQIQHVELARDIAERFNNLFGETFRVPEVVVNKNVARVMSLQDPAKKMSKSDQDQSGCILLQDEGDVIRQKVKRAVTDSENDVRAGSDKPALTNLIKLYAEFSGKTESEIEASYQGKGYGAFKSDLGDLIAEGLAPVQKNYKELLADKAHVQQILTQGLEKALEISSQKIQQVKAATGLLRQ